MMNKYTKMKENSQEYELIGSKRKSIALKVKGDGTVVVRAPWRLSEDKIELPDSALSEWLNRLLFGPYINLWAYVSIASSLLFSFVVILFIITKSRRIRNLSLMGGMLMAIILVFSTLTAYFHKNSITNESEAIVISEEADIHLSPMDKAAVSFKLHEGAKVKIIQENDSWTQIEVNGNSGWILEEEIKRI